MNRVRSTAALWAGIALLVVFGHGRIASAQGQTPDILQGLSFPPLDFEPPRVEPLTLSNGMRLYFIEDHELPTFDLVAYVRTGDVHDPPDKVGLAALTAKVLRTGGTESRDPDAINETLEYIAGSIESGMAAENGTVSLSVMSKDVDLGVELFADILMHPAFREDKFELARKQALEGVRRQNDNPWRIASRNGQKILYGSHPYGNSPTVASLNAITRDDLVSFHERYYRPGAIWIAAAGDVTRDALIEKLENAFAGWDAPPVDVSPTPPVTNVGAPGVYHIEKELNQTSIWMGELGLRRTDPDKLSVTVMNEILGAGAFSSRLFRRVRSERGLAYAVGSVMRYSMQPGYFLAYCMTKPSTTVQAIQLIRQIIEEMREQPVTDQELDLARNSIINSFLFAFTSSAYVAEQQLRLDYFGYPQDYLQTYRDKIAQVTKDEVMRVAKKYLHPDEMTIVTVGQRAQFDRPLEELGPVTEIPLDSE